MMMIGMDGVTRRSVRNGSVTNLHGRLRIFGLVMAGGRKYHFHCPLNVYSTFLRPSYNVFVILVVS